MSLRWSEEQLSDYQRRRDGKGVVRSPSKGIASAQKIQSPESKAELRFSQQLFESGLPPHFRDWYFLEGRDFTLDFAWPRLKIAVEVQGSVHRIKGKFWRDIEKRALALLADWRVLEVDSSAIRDGRAIQWLRTLLGRSA